MRDPMLFGASFPGSTWGAHAALLAGAFGLPMSADQAATFRELANREPPAEQVAEYWLIAGRRAGKDQVAALIACFLAACRHWPTVPGEVPTVLVLAADRDQARVAYSRIRGMLEASPLLAREIVATTADRITLASSVELQIGTSDYRSVRGRALAAVIADEICFWRSDSSASPDSEVIAACRPALATMPGSMLIAISSPYAQRGIAFETFRRYYGTDDPRVLVVRAPSRALNPTIPQSVIDDALERDPQAASAEWLAHWRSDLESFIDAALLDSCTRSGPRELPHKAADAAGVPYHYAAGLDVSGGRGDATAAAVAHVEGERVVVDAVRRWPSPHDPQQVAKQVAEFIGQFKLSSAIADSYAAEFAVTAYRDAGVTLRASDVSRSDSYLKLLPLMTSGRVELPDDPVLRTELLGLERRTGRSGRDSVDHRPGAHDDLANATALAAVAAARRFERASDPAQCIVIESPLFAEYAFRTEIEREQALIAAGLRQWDFP
jgi:hypothetical protein